MTIPRTRRRGIDKLSKRVMVRFAEDDFSDIEKNAKKTNLKPGEYIREVTLNREDISIGNRTKSKESVYPYDGALKVLEGTFYKIINQLDKKIDKPEEVTIFMKRDSKDIVVMDIPELKFHLTFKRVGNLGGKN